MQLFACLIFFLSRSLSAFPSVIPFLPSLSHFFPVLKLPFGNQWIVKLYRMNHMSVKTFRKTRKKELAAKKKDNDIISAYLHVPLCLFPDTFFIFVQRWSNKWQATILMRFKAFKKSFQNEKILLHYFFAFTNEASN